MDVKTIGFWFAGGKYKPPFSAIAPNTGIKLLNLITHLAERPVTISTLISAAAKSSGCKKY
ncbi:hypothetical protein [Nostoc sp. NMS4]|uniref:hypothetical protein n=1 Tax=Nostoc sp. NMS4 TaxID=2815390 RepID=UPI003436BDD5|nr:hypothetical protein [Nostoc sp. NMS4]